MSAAETTLALEVVTVFYGEVVGLSQVSLELGPGITALVGPNGSGKTTLMRLVTGLMRPCEGTVRVLGGDPFYDASVRARLALVPTQESFFTQVSGRRNLEIAFLARGLSRSKAREAASRALQEAGLGGDGDRRYGIWSRGMRQRLKLGLALVAGADLVLLDEPFLGVDPPTRLRLRETIGRMGEQGRTVLVSSHVLHEVEALTDRVAILAQGRLLGMGQIGTLLTELRDQHPHRIHLDTDRPRQLARAMVGLDHVREIRITREAPGGGTLEVVTDRPDRAYRDLVQAAVRAGVVIRRLRTEGGDLESLFGAVTAAGVQRL